MAGLNFKFVMDEQRYKILALNILLLAYEMIENLDDLRLAKYDQLSQTLQPHLNQLTPLLESQIKILDTCAMPDVETGMELLAWHRELIKEIATLRPDDKADILLLIKQYKDDR